MQHAYFSSFNQLKSQFAALSLPFPLSMLKLLSIKYDLKIHVVVWQAKKNCAQTRAARAVRSFFLIQPLKSLICGVVVAVTFVIWELQQGRPQRQRQRQKTTIRPAG